MPILRRCAGVTVDMRRMRAANVPVPRLRRNQHRRPRASTLRGALVTSVEWYTPSHVVELAREVLGGIDLDPCSCAAAQDTVGATVWYDRSVDGLTQPWTAYAGEYHTRIWLNPPYGKQITSWIDRAVDEWYNREASVMLLLPDHTSSKWAVDLLSQPGALVAYSVGRIAFVGAGNAPMHGSMLVYLSHGQQAKGRFVDVVDASDQWYIPNRGIR